MTSRVDPKKTGGREPLAPFAKEDDSVSKQPSEPLRDVAHFGHIELFTPKPTESLFYFQDLLGMSAVHREGRSCYLRGYGDYAVSTLKLTEAERPGVGRIAWRVVSPQALELARILSASKSEVFWKIRLPSSLPFLFSALKIAATTCVIGAIVGEWIGADFGLGALILDSMFNYRSPLLYATVFMSSGLSVLLFAIVSITERRVIRWHT